MKKLFLFLFLLTSISRFDANAQCTPDNAIDSAGGYLYPGVIPFATAGVYYSLVITFKVPKDSMIVLNGLQVWAHVDSAKVLYISGIPKGYQLQCNNATCTWKGGTKGCALLSGIGDSTMIGTYPLMVYMYTWVQLGSAPPYTPYTRVDSSSYTFKILPVGIFEVTPLQHLEAYPNPVKDKLIIELTGINNASNTVEVFDATGRKVFSKQFDHPNFYATTEQVDLSALSNGLFTVVLRSDDKVYMKKVMKD